MPLEQEVWHGGVGVRRLALGVHAHLREGAAAHSVGRVRLQAARFGLALLLLCGAGPAADAPSPCWGL